MPSSASQNKAIIQRRNVPYGDIRGTLKKINYRKK
jgi:hypothetical protein